MSYWINIWAYLCPWRDTSKVEKRKKKDIKSHSWQFNSFFFFLTFHCSLPIQLLIFCPVKSSLFMQSPKTKNWIKIFSFHFTQKRLKRRQYLKNNLPFFIDLLSLRTELSYQYVSITRIFGTLARISLSLTCPKCIISYIGPKNLRDRHATVYQGT